VGVGFAVPVNEARRLLPRLAQGERVEHPWLGISGTALTPQLAEELGLSVPQGVLVYEALPDSPALRAGVRGGRQEGQSDMPTGGDLITAVDGTPIRSVQELSGYINTLRVGDQVRLTILRSGQVIELSVTLAAWPVEQQP
jgi:S1-C subfamily serine protease